MNSFYITQYHNYKDKIYSHFYYRLSGDREQAEDLTSKTFLRAFEKIDTYNNNYSFSTWIYTIARNILIDEYRSTKGKNLVHGDEYFDGVIDDSVCLEEDLDISFDMDKILGLMDELSLFQKEIIHMRYLDGLSYSEISEITDSAEPRIRQENSRAIRKLKKLIS